MWCSTNKQRVPQAKDLTGPNWTKARHQRFLKVCLIFTEFRDCSEMFIPAVFTLRYVSTYRSFRKVHALRSVTVHGVRRQWNPPPFICNWIFRAKKWVFVMSSSHPLKCVYSLWSLLISCTRPLFLKHLSAPPEVTSFKVSSIGATSVTLRWEPIPLCKQGGIVVLYQIGGDGIQPKGTVNRAVEMLM